MGNCMTALLEEPEPRACELAVNRSKQIDRQLKEDFIKTQGAREIKILLLGAGEAGKTTVLKQMQIIHERGGFTDFQRDHYHRQVFTNLCEGMRLCLEFMGTEEIEIEDKSLMASLPLFRRSMPTLESGTTYPQHYLEPLKRLWRDVAIRIAVSRGNEWAMPENMNYFYPDLDRLFSPRYTPTDQDILNCRGKSLGITEMSFKVAELTYRVFDVGGQRSERKKWIHCFQGVTAVLFLVAISGYDSALLEDKTSNQMQEALTLFDSIAHVPFFSQSSMILFLNKTDLFKEKILHTPISNYFPDFEGDEEDHVACQIYFKNRFLKLNRLATRPIYASFTCATNTSKMKSVMAGVNDTIIRKNLQGFC